jgi:hypothetical protein
MTHSLWYIVNLIANEILKGMSHSDPEKIENEQKISLARVMHDPQH